MSSLKRGRNEFSHVLKPCSLRKKGELHGQTGVLKQGLRKPEYGDRSNQIKGRQRRTMAVALHPLPLFPVSGRNFAACGRLSIEKGGGI
jgi:hypothetical protein